jgi:hypothetical protein
VLNTSATSRSFKRVATLLNILFGLIAAGIVIGVFKYLLIIVALWFAGASRLLSVAIAASIYLVIFVLSLVMRRRGFESWKAVAWALSPVIGLLGIVLSATFLLGICNFDSFHCAMPVSAQTLPSRGISNGAHIAIEKEVLVSAARLQPKQLIFAADGSIIVAGNSNHASAAAMSSEVNLLLTYEDPTPPKNGVAEKSSYNGVAQLSNGNFLFCGERGAPGTHTTNLITILDKKGNLIESRTQTPGNDPSLIVSGFEKCVLFHKNVLLFGGVSNGTRGYAWVMKLDSDGKTMTQSVFEYRNSVVASTSDTPSVIEAGPDESSKNEFTSYRISFDGKVLARRTLDGGFPIVLRSEEESQVTAIIAYTQSGEAKAILYTLDKSFQELAKPREIEYFDMARGFGYRLADGSVALFGRRRSLATNAAVVWIPANGEPTQFRQFDNTYPSNSVEAGIAKSSHEFVTARNTIRPGETSGLVISWITVR